MRQRTRFKSKGLTPSIFVELETLKWVDWFNNRRLLEPIGDIPPTEFEKLHYENQEAPVMVAGLK